MAYYNRLLLVFSYLYFPVLLPVVPDIMPQLRHTGRQILLPHLLHQVRLGDVLHVPIDAGPPPADTAGAAELPGEVRDRLDKRSGGSAVGLDHIVRYCVFFKQGHK